MQEEVGSFWHKAETCDNLCDLSGNDKAGRECSCKCFIFDAQEQPQHSLPLS